MTDSALIQIVDRALEEAAQKSGPHLVCRPGCAECCIGPFEINQLDARRLREGLSALERSDPERAARVRERAKKAPGDEEPCPALDPETRTCDLYSWRPMICRTFGPAAPSGDGAYSICELCYTEATEDEIAACAVEFDPEDTESALNDEVERETGVIGPTTVASCLR